MRNYKGVIQDEAVQSTVFNHHFMGMFVNKAVKAAAGLQPEAFLASVTKDLRKEFGSHIQVQYYDPMLGESIEYIDEYTEFCLRISTTSIFHSLETH
jgi:hypothetical protein